MSCKISSMMLVAAGGVAIGCCVTLVLIKSNSLKRWCWRETKQRSVASSVRELAIGIAGGLKGANYDVLNSTPEAVNFLQDEVIREQFTRNVQFFGLESQLQVYNAFVVVVGLGGVGSHAAAMLLRSGIGRIRLVDFDQVSLSSLNRHAVATRGDVGMPKAICLRDHFLRIFPECCVDACVQMYDASTEQDILAGQPDFVLDCIDNIDTKVSLLAACVRKGLRIISATGAGARVDPTRIRIADLSESSVDPLSRAVRHRLRREHQIETGIPVVFSTERPRAKLIPFKGPNGEDADPYDYQVVPGFRVRIIPVMGSIPAIFGQVMASYVTTKIAGIQVNFEPLLFLDRDHYKILHHRLIEREEVRFGTATDVEVDEEEVAYVVRELWHGRSARGQSPMVASGRWRYVNKLTLTRWDSSKSASVTNLVLFTFQEAEEHDATTLHKLQECEPEFYAMVSNVLQRAAKEHELRP